MLPHISKDYREFAAKVANPWLGCGQVATPRGANSCYPPFSFYPIRFQIYFLVLTILLLISVN